MKDVLIKILESLGLDRYVYVRDLRTDEDGKRIYKDGMIRWQFRSTKDNKVLYTSYAENSLWFVTPRTKEDKSYVKDLVKHHVKVVKDAVERATNDKKKTKTRVH